MDLKEYILPKNSMIGGWYIPPNLCDELIQIFKDKVHLLIKILKDNRNTGNLMPKKKEKGYKTVLNLLRTLGPMEFEIRPKNSKDGEGFILHPFDMVDKNTTLLNYMFDAVFFLPLHIVKNALSGPVKKTS